MENHYSLTPGCGSPACSPLPYSTSDSSELLLSMDSSETCFSQLPPSACDEACVSWVTLEASTTSSICSLMPISSLRSLNSSSTFFSWKLSRSMLTRLYPSSISRNTSSGQLEYCLGQQQVFFQMVKLTLFLLFLGFLGVLVQLMAAFLMVLLRVLSMTALSSSLNCLRISWWAKRNLRQTRSLRLCFFRRRKESSNSLAATRMQKSRRSTCIRSKEGECSCSCTQGLSSVSPCWMSRSAIAYVLCLQDQLHRHHLRSFSGKRHSLPGVYRSRSYSSFRLCMLPTKPFWLPFCLRSVKKRSTAFMATRSVETGQMTQLQPYCLKVSMSMQGVLPNSVMLASRKISLLCFFNSFATIWNSSAVSSPSGKIMSAPALMQLLEREMHSSSPKTPFASVRAQMTNYPSDTLMEVSLAILILSTICCTEMSSLPLRWPHRLGNTWSSMCRPEAPEQKYSLTVLAHISPSPKPVSASAITGRLEKVETSLMTEQNSLSERRPMSGTPEEAVSAPPETQRALKSC